MGDIDWRREDVGDLVRRDRRLLLQQGSPFVVASAVFGMWLRGTWPIVSGVFLGMSLAWVLSLVSSWRSSSKRWQVYVSAQPQPLTCTVDPLGLSWHAAHGERNLNWSAVLVKRLGRTWLLLVGGHEAAYLPARCLTDSETKILEAQSQRNEG